MSMAQHPAGQQRRCRFDDTCPEPAVALVAWATGGPAAAHFVHLQPRRPGVNGQPVCLDHGHHLVDLMLLRSQPAPGRRSA